MQSVLMQFIFMRVEFFLQQCMNREASEVYVDDIFLKNVSFWFIAVPFSNFVFQMPVIQELLLRLYYSGVLHFFSVRIISIKLKFRS
jgi:hypothetical protein